MSWGDVSSKPQNGGSAHGEVLAGVPRPLSPQLLLFPSWKAAFKCGPYANSRSTPASHECRPRAPPVPSPRDLSDLSSGRGPRSLPSHHVLVTLTLTLGLRHPCPQLPQVPPLGPAVSYWGDLSSRALSGYNLGGRSEWSHDNVRRQGVHSLDQGPCSCWTLDGHPPVPPRDAPRSPGQVAVSHHVVGNGHGRSERSSSSPKLTQPRRQSRDAHPL